MQPLVPLGPVQAPPASLPLAVDGVAVGHVASDLVAGLITRLRQLKVALVARQEGWPTLQGFPLPTVRAQASVAACPRWPWPELMSAPLGKRPACSSLLASLLWLMSALLVGRQPACVSACSCLRGHSCAIHVLQVWLV